MRLPDYYETDVLAFFAGKPWALPLYEAVFAQMDRLFPDAAVKVQKSQISFYGRHLFAAVSLPLRRKKTWPEECIIVTFGLGAKVEDPRIAVAVEPYPNRWTHHVMIGSAEEIDQELLGWLWEAAQFAASKPRKAVGE